MGQAMQKSTLIAAICGSLAAPVHAQVLTGNDLLGACEVQGATVQAGFCLGYIVGVIEGLKLGAAIPLLAARDENSEQEPIDPLTNSFLHMCIPAESENSQSVDIAVKYLRANPDIRHNPARGLILASLREAYPCP